MPKVGLPGQDVKQKYALSAKKNEKAGVQVKYGDDFGILPGYNAKLSVKGNVLEFSKFERRVGMSRGGKNTAVPSDDERMFVVDDKGVSKVAWYLSPGEVEERNTRSVRESLRRARKKLADLLNLNFSGKSFFLTLTFSDSPTLEEAWGRFSEFRRRLSKKCPFLFINVLELQPHSKKPHFHLLLSFSSLEWTSYVQQTRFYCFHPREKGETGLLKVLSHDYELTEGFHRVKLFQDEALARKTAKKLGLRVAYTSPLVSLWWWGFIEVHEIRDRDGNSIADVGAYMLKYMTKETSLPSGVHRYSYSRGELKTTAQGLKDKAAEKFFSFIYHHCRDFLRFEKSYDGENEFTGKWAKTFLTFAPGFLHPRSLKELFQEYYEAYGGYRWPYAIQPPSLEENFQTCLDYFQAIIDFRAGGGF